MEGEGDFNPEPLGKIEQFAGYESRVFAPTEEQIRNLKVRPPTERDQEIANLLLTGAALDRKTLNEIFERHGFSRRSIQNLDFDIETGRFTAKTDIPMRVVKVGREKVLVDARLPESDFHLPTPG